MSYSKYGSSNSARYNNSKHFVPPGKSSGRTMPYNSSRRGPPTVTSSPQQEKHSHQSQNQHSQKQHSQQSQKQQSQPHQQSQSQQPSQTQEPSQSQQQVQPQQEQPQQQQQQESQQAQQQSEHPEDLKSVKQDDEMETEDTSGRDGSPPRPHWMKNKLQGVKKITNKERRRRQNENLRRLLTPKNALMVLNEIMPGEQVASQFKVEPVSGGTQFYRANVHSFCANLTLHGNKYKGYGENKLTARNAAAEQAIRDLMLQRMGRLFNEARDGTVPPGTAEDDAEGDGELEEDSLPMIQLASYALHKLFAEWEYEGHKVPNLRPAPPSPRSSPPPSRAPPGVRALPSGAAAMHPCMLLTYMRPNLEYRELTPEGDCQQNIVFTMAIDIDGCTYVGRAQNKKEARKLAAKAACEALFDLKFENVTA